MSIADGGYGPTPWLQFEAARRGISRSTPAGQEGSSLGTCHREAKPTVRPKMTTMSLAKCRSRSTCERSEQCHADGSAFRYMAQSLQLRTGLDGFAQAHSEY